MVYKTAFVGGVQGQNEWKQGRVASGHEPKIRILFSSDEYVQEAQ
jgi:hypothetical protein